MKTKRQRRKAHTASQRKYDKEHTTRVSLKFNNRTDSDILIYLEGENKQGLIKEAIREHMIRHYVMSN